jgi:hypothetical protein
MSLGRGKLYESIATVPMFPARVINSNTVFYNGGPWTNAASNGIDTLGYDNCEFILNIGSVAGAGSSIANSIYESLTDDPSAATLVTGAAFTTVRTGDDTAAAGWALTTTVCCQRGSVSVKNHHRYFFLKTETSSNTGCVPTVYMSAIAILGKADTQATNETQIFDLA